MHPQQSRPIIEQSLIKGKPFECTVRYRMPDGKMCVHLMRALPVFGSDGAPERMIGTLQDITADAQRGGLAPADSEV
jgi:PAS domain-containing protein